MAVCMHAYVLVRVCVCMCVYVCVCVCARAGRGGGMSGGRRACACTGGGVYNKFVYVSVCFDAEQI